MDKIDKLITQLRAASRAILAGPTIERRPLPEPIREWGRLTELAKRMGREHAGHPDLSMTMLDEMQDAMRKLGVENLPKRDADRLLKIYEDGYQSERAHRRK